MIYIEANFSDLIGKVLIEIQNNRNEELIFICNNGDKYILFHEQSCCEDVMIDDICGDLDDLLNSPILLAEESSNSELPPTDRNKGTHTWTFYKLATREGYVDIRWYGTSNGYYSERVDFKKIMRIE